MEEIELLDALEELYHATEDFDVNPQERFRAGDGALTTLRKYGRDPMSTQSLRAFQLRKRRSMKTERPESLCDVKVLTKIKLTKLDLEVQTVHPGQILVYDPKRPGIWIDQQWWGGPALDYAFDGEEPALLVECETGATNVDKSLDKGLKGHILRSRESRTSK